MNVLDLIRTKMLKKKRLNEAQFMMAKAYRGVPYVDPHHDDPSQDTSTKEHTYRGVTYEDAHHNDPSQEASAKELTYRGQSYTH